MHRFLAAAFANPRAAVITRRPGEGWRSEPAAWPLHRIAAGVYDPARVVGIRPEGLIRVVVVDIDRKHDRVSPFWDPFGQSRQLLALEREAAAAGCSVTVVRSSASGGLHALVSLPEPVKAWQAHWVGAELITRAGMKEAPGVCELFPSRLAYSASTNPADWAQSHGFRLPGQEGSALLVGTTTASDTALIYSELLEALEGTAAGDGWQELLEAATARQKATRAPQAHHRPRHPSRRAHGVRWTGAGQTNQNLAQLTSWTRAAHPEAVTAEALAPIIEAAAWSAPGFVEWASETTRRGLAAWCRRWAVSSLRRDRSPQAPTPEGDKHHNSRLLKLSRAKLTRAWRSAGAAAAEWSQRRVSEVSGLSRRIVCKHWAFWVQLLGGPHPLITGGPALAVLSSESFDPAVSVPPATSGQVPAPAVTAEPEPKPPKPSDFGPHAPPAPAHAALLPFRVDEPPPDPWRARQRAELAAWLAAAARGPNPRKPSRSS